MLFFLAGMNFHLPKEAREGSLGYGYTLDEEKFCSKLQKANKCQGVYENECKEITNDMEKCINATDEWIDDLNRLCENEINIFENCLEDGSKCEIERHNFIQCYWRTKPKWMQTDIFDYWKEK
ncbi:unnamed protein product [Blepharisma stoltei]|uniref:Uncharacterized protein n=1 Tax=Blepharisma stoltei TaxID=1481888 RepID=A0AAU9IP57_9CILI|nr:unnamed protein product [Blepharisma stoltei]